MFFSVIAVIPNLSFGVWMPRETVLGGLLLDQSYIGSFRGVVL